MVSVSVPILFHTFVAVLRHGSDVQILTSRSYLSPGSRHRSLTICQIDPSACTPGTSHPSEILLIVFFHYSYSSPLVLFFCSLTWYTEVTEVAKALSWVISLSLSFLNYKLTIHSQLLPLLHIPSLIKNLGFYSLNIFALDVLESISATTALVQALIF